MIFKRLPTALLAIALTSLSGCYTTNSVSAPVEHDVLGDNSSDKVSQCAPFDENAEMKMCTMHFDPVCVKEKDANGKISYRTAGNSCTACTTAQAISYTPGECR